MNKATSFQTLSRYAQKMGNWHGMAEFCGFEQYANVMPTNLSTGNVDKFTASIQGLDANSIRSRPKYSAD